MTISDRAQISAILQTMLAVLVHLHNDGKTREDLLVELGRLIDALDD